MFSDFRVVVPSLFQTYVAPAVQWASSIGNLCQRLDGNVYLYEYIENLEYLFVVFISSAQGLNTNIRNKVLDTRT